MTLEGGTVVFFYEEVIAMKALSFFNPSLGTDPRTVISYKNPLISQFRLCASFHIVESQSWMGLNGDGLEGEAFLLQLRPRTCNPLQLSGLRVQDNGKEISSTIVRF